MLEGPTREPNLPGFIEADAAGRFAGVSSDPVPLALTSRGTPQPR
ncbi:hypothetical protein [Cryobacterium sp. Y62]|nr:hypothetical protein [Cryobacterium sp. Y62]